MFIKKLFSSALILLVISCSGNKKEFSQWRGPDRDGKYPDTGLLKQWPEEGPEMLWSFEGLGAGHGSASIAGDRLFVLGMPDSIGVIYSFDLEGNLLWQKEYGPEWHTNYTGSRSTPTIVDGLMYFVSGLGEAFCMETGTGELHWSIDMFAEFGAQETDWGIAESPLIDGDRIILTPGGAENNVVALDRFTGELIWTSKGNGEPSAYCSPILAQQNDTKLILTLTSESVIGIDAETGETYWRIELMQQNKINANSPLFSEGKIYCGGEEEDTASTGHVMINLSTDGKTAEVGWRNTELFNLIGGLILHDGSLYSSRFGKKEWYCIDAETGTTNYISDKVSGGSIIVAEGLFYNYGTDGSMALVEADENDCNVISSFEITLGTDQHWARPVIHEGRLYMRHGDALMSYDIAAE